ncbi:MAG: ATP-dependent 6-phosphofructokinase [Actinobacteria bacterium]|nr:ATP-dependent 6-phosphofructokinase [Actinomycetota bacterium]
MNVGVLTGGGDCPGLNAAIRAIVVKGERRYGDEVVGFLDGWRGLLEDSTMALASATSSELVTVGGTILGTSRTNPFSVDRGMDRISQTVSSHSLDALIAIGGEDTLGVAARLWEEGGIPIVGVPKTIDNDLSGTEMTFGFDTAVQIATEAIDRLRTTAESHHRVIVCEVMGRNAGWIATYAGIAGGAAEILVPEEPFEIDEVCDRLRKRHNGGKFSSVVVIAEGASARSDSPGLALGGSQGGTPAGGMDEFGHIRLGGIGSLLAEEIERRTGFESRVTILGHIQRGGTPTAYDRVLATRYGVAAIDSVHTGAFGTMVALQAGKIVRVSLAEASGNAKTVDPELLHDVAEVFLG